MTCYVKKIKKHLKNSLKALGLFNKDLFKNTYRLPLVCTDIYNNTTTDVFTLKQTEKLSAYHINRGIYFKI